MASRTIFQDSAQRVRTIDGPVGTQCNFAPIISIVSLIQERSSTVYLLTYMGG